MVNDLVSTWPKRAKYVDDLTILEIIPRNPPSYLNCILDDISCFSHRNNMRLNPAKCKAMTIDFLDYNSCTWRPICTGGVVIERVKSFKLLGVYISEDLTWGVHSDYIIKKANRRLYAFRTLKKCGVPTSDLITVYYSRPYTISNWIRLGCILEAAKVSVWCVGGNSKARPWDNSSECTLWRARHWY